MGRTSSGQAPRLTLPRPGDPTGLRFYIHVHIRAAGASTEVAHLPGPHRNDVKVPRLPEGRLCTALPSSSEQEEHGDLRCQPLCLHWWTGAHLCLLVCTPSDVPCQFCHHLTEAAPSLLYLVLLWSKQKRQVRLLCSPGWEGSGQQLGKTSQGGLAQRYLPPQLFYASQLSSLGLTSRPGNLARKWGHPWSSPKQEPWRYLLTKGELNCPAIALPKLPVGS